MNNPVACLFQLSLGFNRLEGCEEHTEVVGGYVWLQGGSEPLTASSTAISSGYRCHRRLEETQSHGSFSQFLLPLSSFFLSFLI